MGSRDEQRRAETSRDEQRRAKSQEPEIQIVREPEIQIAREPEIRRAREPEIQIAREPEIRIVREPDIQIAREPEIQIAKEILHHPQGNCKRVLLLVWPAYSSLQHPMLLVWGGVTRRLIPSTRQRHGMHRICISAIRISETAATTDGRYSSAPRATHQRARRTHRHPQEAR